MLSENLSAKELNLLQKEVEKNLVKLEETVNGFEGKVQKTEKMGRRKLAYEIQKFTDGYFVTQIISLPANKVKDFRRSLRLNENILRTMILDVTEKVALK